MTMTPLNPDARTSGRPDCGLRHPHTILGGLEDARLARMTMRILLPLGWKRG